MNQNTINENWDIDFEELELCQEAYLDGTLDNPYYTAKAVDKDGNQYMVIWEIFESYVPENNDEGFACDWDEPTSINILHARISKQETERMKRT